MEKKKSTHLTDLCRELFFPFDSYFFSERYCLGNDASEGLKKIDSLFNFLDEKHESVQSNPSFDAIVALQRDETGDDKNSIISSIMPLPGILYENIHGKGGKTDPFTGTELGQTGRLSSPLLAQPNNNATEKPQGDEEIESYLISNNIIQQLNELLLENTFDRNSLDRWLFFHRKLTDLISSTHPLASGVLKLVMPHIKLIIDSADRADSIWIYAEKAFYQLFEKIRLSEFGEQNTLSFPHTTGDKFSSIIVVIKEILQIKNTAVKTVYYTSLNTLKHLFDENPLGQLESQVDENGNSSYYPQIMSVSTMNDPEEGHFLQSILSDDIGHLHRYWWDSYDSKKALVQQRYYSIEPFVFCKSFSDLMLKDDLSMWEIYGDRAEGCCCEVEIKCGVKHSLYNVAYLAARSPGAKYEIVQIGSEPKPLNKKASLPGKFELLSISLDLLKEYLVMIKEEIDTISTDVEKHSSCVDSTETIEETRRGIMEITYLFKDASYSHESEIRYLDSFPESDQIKPVGGSSKDKRLPLLSVKSKVGFDYKEVILGPKVKAPDIAAAYFIHMFNKNKKTGVAPVITKSAIQYR